MIGPMLSALLSVSSADEDIKSLGADVDVNSAAAVVEPSHIEQSHKEHVSDPAKTDHLLYECCITIQS